MEDGGEKSPGAPGSEGLWNFALRVYAQPGVQVACLRAQDEHDVDVNLLLFALWAATRNRELDRCFVEAADQRCDDWRRAVILPLREQRRLWKTAEQRSVEYTAIKSLELAAERSQLGWLEAMLDDSSDKASAPLDSSLAQSNATVVLSYFEVQTGVAADLLAALLEAHQSSPKNPPD